MRFSPNPVVDCVNVFEITQIIAVHSAFGKFGDGGTRHACVLQCVAVCHSALQCVTVCCSVSQCVAECRSVLQCVAMCCRVSQCVADDI